MHLVLALVLPFGRLHRACEHRCSSGQPAACTEFAAKFRRLLDAARLCAHGIDGEHVAVFAPEHALRPQYEAPAISGFCEPTDEHFEVLNTRAGALIDLGFPGTFADDDPRRAPVLLVMY